ncbi:MAG: BON domain-containing protein [Pseudomonadales bacterium]|nr:BON domain-containing protein [Pseudomonadales bacterium]
MHRFIKAKHQILKLLLISLMLLTCACSQLIVASSGKRIADQNHGKRTLGAFIEDQSIENKALINIRNIAPELGKSRIKITSYNGTVLIAGQTTSSQSKAKAKDIVKEIRHVQRVYNALEISKSSSLLVRLNDSWLSFKIKLALMMDKKTPSNRIIIATENSSIYLMGLLNQKEESAAIARIRQIRGVQKIIKLTEYIEQ